METWEGVIDFLSLLNLVILGNVLDHRTYTAPNQHASDKPTKAQKERLEVFDLNAIPRIERDEAILARGMCLHMLQWFQAHFQIWRTDTNEEVTDITSWYLGKQAAAILEYKRLATAKKVLGAPNCTLNTLLLQLENVLALFPEARKVFKQTHAEYSLDFGRQSATFYEVKRIDPPEKFPGN